MSKKLTQEELIKTIAKYALESKDSDTALQSTSNPLNNPSFKSFS